jgi:hypothetical protein
MSVARREMQGLKGCLEKSYGALDTSETDPILGEAAVGKDND